MRWQFSKWLLKVKLFFFIIHIVSVSRGSLINSFTSLSNWIHRFFVDDVIKGDAAEDKKRAHLESDIVNCKVFHLMALNCMTRKISSLYQQFFHIISMKVKTARRWMKLNEKCYIVVYNVECFGRVKVAYCWWQIKQLERRRMEIKRVN